jgi:hypothetical protein
MLCQIKRARGKLISGSITTRRGQTFTNMPLVNVHQPGFEACCFKKVNRSKEGRLSSRPIASLRATLEQILLDGPFSNDIILKVINTLQYFYFREGSMHGCDLRDYLPLHT